MTVLLVIGVIALAFMGYFFSGLIAVIFMEKVGNEVALLASVKHAKNCKAARFHYDETIARQCVAVNIQIRIVMTLLIYVLSSAAVFIICCYLKTTIAITICMALNVGLLIRCLLAVIGEYCCWPDIVRFEGVDYQQKVIRMQKMLLEENEEPGTELTYGLDLCDDIDSVLSNGEIAIVFVSKDGGDVIYDSLS